MRAGNYTAGYAEPMSNGEDAGKMSVTAEAVEDDKAKNNSLYFWLGLGALYIIWDYFVLRNKTLSEAIEPANIRTNLYNIMFTGFAAVIFVNGMKVLLVKVVAFKIPVLSKLAQMLLPLFQLM